MRIPNSLPVESHNDVSLSIVVSTPNRCPRHQMISLDAKTSIGLGRNVKFYIGQVVVLL
jgi:hypothetical protein